MGGLYEARAPVGWWMCIVVVQPLHGRGWIDGEDERSPTEQNEGRRPCERWAAKNLPRRKGKEIVPEEEK